MLKNIMIGQYIEADSILHRLDPRTKLISMMLIMALAFLAGTSFDYGLLLGLVVLAYLLSGIKLGHLYRGMRLILIFVYITFFLHLLSNREGDLVWQYGIIKIYTGGLSQGLMISFRLFVLIYFSTLLTLTTSPMNLTDGIETLLRPLKKIIPVHELALMLTIAIRFIPTIIRETDRIMKAQAARGASLSTGPIGQRINHSLTIVVPLLVSSFRRAEDLATAMEARAYRGGEGRSKFRQLVFARSDLLAGLLLVCLTVIIIYHRLVS